MIAPHSPPCLRVSVFRLSAFPYSGASVFPCASAFPCSRQAPILIARVIFNAYGPADSADSALWYSGMPSPVCGHLRGSQTGMNAPLPFRLTGRWRLKIWVSSSSVITNRAGGQAGSDTTERRLSLLTPGGPQCYSGIVVPYYIFGTASFRNRLTSAPENVRVSMQNENTLIFPARRRRAAGASGRPSPSRRQRQSQWQEQVIP